jgi:hypothetical protein
MIRREKTGVDRFMGKLVIAWNDSTEDATYGILTGWAKVQGKYKPFTLDNNRKTFKHVCPFVDEDFYHEFKSMSL